MKVSEFVANYLASLSQDKTRVYAICGAGAMHLNDAICHHPGIDVVAMQHEQAATYAAECEARVTNRIGVVHVTTGPGGSNAITGVACAYVDSIPLLVIAGQVPQDQSTVVAHRDNYGLRQAGMNELDVVALMSPVTVYAKTMTEPMMARYDLEKAVYFATHGRKGPAFIEIPLDIQAAEVDPDKLTGFTPEAEQDNADYIADAADAIALRMANAKRPVLIIGNGVRLAGAQDELLRVIDELGCPVVSSWTGSDLVPSDHPFYLGRCGLFGDIPSNYAVQHADTLLCIGTRLSVAQIGHHAKLFAPNAYKIVVDVDANEAKKSSVSAQFPVVADAAAFLKAFRPQKCNQDWARSRRLARDNTPAYDGGGGWQINSYDFCRQLEKHMDDDAIVVTDVGFSFIPLMQTLRLKKGQRLIHSCGVSPMGWGLPAAIGASLSSGRQVICCTGDGGLMLNIQELLTISERKLPITIFVFANDGYATMRIAQKNHFGRESIAGPASGLSIPAHILAEVAYSFGFGVMVMGQKAALDEGMHVMLASVKKAGYPLFVVLTMPPDQVIAPRVQAKQVDGKFLPVTLTDMWMPEDVSDRQLA